ncbi:HdeD family acid-resistance protein [Microbacterium sp.]|uniref:HdeD family acid-resistance protein n=1 Tax=Microbacterium sp. TaxID=51671 RepID=UPI003F9C3731
MSESLTEAKSLFTSIRVSLAISGAIALIAGIVLLVWPLKTAVIVTGIIAAYLIIAGLVYVGLGIFSGKKGGWARVGHIVLGLLYIVAGVIAFLNLAAATLTLAVITAIFLGISWIVDGIVSLTLLNKDGSKAWTIIYAIISIAAGIIVLFSPLLAAVALWWVLGIALVVLGIIQIVRAITLGRGASESVGAAEPVNPYSDAGTTPAV